MELLGVYYTSLDIESKYAEDLTATLIGWQLLAVTKKERVAELKASHTRLITAPEKAKGKAETKSEEPPASDSDSISDNTEDAESETDDCITDPVELVSKESKT